MIKRKDRSFFHPRTIEFVGKGRRPIDWGQEFSAGITVGLIALPLSLALGIASIPGGMEVPLPPPALGIITAILAGVVVSLMGGSRVQIAGPTAAFVPIILLIVSKHGYTGLILATMMAGVILILMGLTGMGALIKFIPWPVTSGFTTGIAVAIAMSQLPDALGLPSGNAPSHFFERVHWLFTHAPESNGFAIIVASSCTILIAFWPYLHLRKIPGSIVAMILATVVVFLLGWGNSHGVETVGIKFGANAIPSSLPKPELPAITFQTLRELLGPATAIAILGSIESLLSAVVADGLSGDRHDSNTELIAQGIANLVCPLFGGLPATGAIARTSANISNGGKTPFAGMIHSATLLVVVLLAAKWAAYIPMACMAAVLIVVAFRMGEWDEFRRLHKMPKSDAIVFLTTFILTVVFDLVIAVEVGMVLAAMLFIRRVSETTEIALESSGDGTNEQDELYLGKDIPEGVMVYRIMGPFLFGAAMRMAETISSLHELPEVLILRLKLVTAMDYTGLNALTTIVEHVHAEGRHILISGIQPQPLRLLQKADFTKLIGEENLCATFDIAIKRARQLTQDQQS